MAVQFSMAVLDDLALRTAINEAVMADMPDEKSMQPPSEVVLTSGDQAIPKGSEILPIADMEDSTLQELVDMDREAILGV